MPLFCIHGLDRKGAEAVRAGHYPAHRAFLERASDWGVTIAASGPLMSDDGERMLGSLLIVEADSAVTVASFNAADPFAQAGLWERVNISRFNLRRGAIGLTA